MFKLHTVNCLWFLRLVFSLFIFKLPHRFSPLLVHITLKQLHKIIIRLTEIIGAAEIDNLICFDSCLERLGMIAGQLTAESN